MTPICISCGMPMRESSDHSLGNPVRDWCRHCSDDDGAMPTYEKTCRRLAHRLQAATGQSPDGARRAVEARLAELPAWRGH